MLALSSDQSYSKYQLTLPDFSNFIFKYSLESPVLELTFKHGRNSLAFCQSKELRILGSEIGSDPWGIARCLACQSKYEKVEIMFVSPGLTLLAC